MQANLMPKFKISYVNRIIYTSVQYLSQLMRLKSQSIPDLFVFGNYTYYSYPKWEDFATLSL